MLKTVTDFIASNPVQSVVASFCVGAFVGVIVVISIIG